MYFSIACACSSAEMVWSMVETVMYPPSSR
jgi:hypothetical protein